MKDSDRSRHWASPMSDLVSASSVIDGPSPATARSISSRPVVEAATGLAGFYFGARHFSPAIGRFMRPDDPGYADPANSQSWNLYTYALNNPLRYIDPTGHITVSAEYGGFDEDTIKWFLERQWSFDQQLAAARAAQQTPQVAVQNNPVCSSQPAVGFIQAHRADAATVAQGLRVPTQNVLGLSGIESFWGTSDAATKANNFFGLHGGANAPFATGVWVTKGGVAMSKFPSYLASAQSFAAQFGNFVAGLTSPTSFAEGLVRAGFNPARAPGNPNFIRDTANTINSTSVRLQCH